MIDDGRQVVLRLEDFIPELYIGKDEVKTAEGFLVLLALVLGKGEGHIPNTLFLDQLAK